MLAGAANTLLAAGAVSVAAGALSAVNTSCGVFFEASLELTLRITLALAALCRATLTTLRPCARSESKKLVRSISIHAELLFFTVTALKLAPRAGLLFQVRPVSDQVVTGTPYSVEVTLPLADSPAYKRSFACTKAGTAVVSILGSGLDTEFMMALAGTSEIPDSSAAMYNNWIGTIPWLWTLAGLAGVGLYVASRRDVAPRWIGRVGLVLGGLTVLLGISPLEYMSGVTGVLWLLVTSLGLAFGDRRFRGATQA